MEGRNFIRENGSKQSLMTALSKFVEAVSMMENRVMIPSRLRDIGFSHSTSEENNNMSVLPFSSSSNDDSLYSYYVMLNRIKREVLCGNAETDINVVDFSSEYTVDGENNSAEKTANAIRHHLQCLFRLLHQLTGTAKFLGDTYEDQVGGRKDKKISM